MATEWREAFCVLCGRTMGKRTHYRQPGKPYFGVESEENLWDKTKEFTGEKPFGVIKSSEGRGSMQLVRYYGVEEDKDGYFPAMKARLLAVIGEWIAKGWLTTAEVAKIVNEARH